MGFPLRRLFALAFDLLFLLLLIVGARLLTTAQLSSSLLALALWTIGLLPVYLFLTIRILGASPGQKIAGIRRIHRGTGKRLTRPYDFLFESEVIETPESSLPFWIQGLSLVALLTLLAGSLLFSAAKDPLLRSWKDKPIALFAPSPRDSAWEVLPWFYASGAWPTVFEKEPVTYSLPYEKGPPQRFVGKIQSYWGNSGVRVTLVGPLTLRGTGSRTELRRCFQRLFGCTSLRKEVFERPLSPVTNLIQPTVTRWFTVENPVLGDDERPEGIYLQGRKKNGETVEGYFLVNSRMTFQGFVLSRYENEEGLAASRLLEQAIGSLRVSSDLEGARAWINQTLSKTDLRREISTEKILQSQALLLSKVSVEPTSFEPFFFLAGTSHLLFKQARARRDTELAASAKAMVLSAARYAADIDASHAQMKEIEYFRASLETL